MKTICFVRDSFYPRMYNEIFALKESGDYRIIFVCINYKYDKFVDCLFDKVFTLGVSHNFLDGLHNLSFRNLGLRLHNFYLYTVKKKLFSLYLRKLRNIVSKLDDEVDVFNCQGASVFTRVVLDCVSKPVIMDLHNGSMARGIENLSDDEKVLDRFCFENVTGFIHRGSKYEFPYYKRFYHVNQPVHVFMDYCNRVFNEQDGFRFNDGSFHVVMMGAGYRCNDYIDNLGLLVSQGFDIHQFLVNHSLVGSGQFNDFKSFEQDNVLFHMYGHVPFYKVPKVISVFNYGMKLDTAGHSDNFNYDYFKVASIYRLFSFLDAGLPVIFHRKYDFVGDIIRKYDVGVLYDDVDLADLVSIFDGKDFSGNVDVARNELDVLNFSDSLNDFYRGFC